MMLRSSWVCSLRHWLLDKGQSLSRLLLQEAPGCLLTMSPASNTACPFGIRPGCLWTTASAFTAARAFPVSTWRSFCSAGWTGGHCTSELAAGCCLRVALVLAVQ